MAWLDGWLKRIKITIDKDQVDLILSGFPTPVYLSASSGQSNDDVSAIFDELTSDANRKKIAITTSDEETQCYVEIERWDDANEKAWLHVNVPTITSGTDTSLYLYYDSSQSDNTSYVGDVGSTPGQAVWDSNFKAVYHLGEDPSGGTDCIKDSTSNINHGTPSGTMLTEDLVDGQFGKALEFDGSNDYVDCGSGSSIDDITAKTVEVIANPSSGSGVQQIVSKDDNNNGWSILCHEALSRIQFRQCFNTAHGGWHMPFTPGTIQHIVITYNSSNTANNPLMYKNGISQTVTESSVPTVTVLSDGAFNLLIAQWSGTPDYFHKGIIDEVRISDIVRSAEWIKATYEGLWDNLLTFGGEETTPAFYYEGYITVESVPAARVVNLYKRDTGALIDSTTSSGSGGYFKLESSYNDYHFVVVLPGLSEDYAVLTDDKIHPTGGN